MLPGWAQNREELYFTSGGTEGNNLALFGAALAKKRQGNRIVTTLAEHDSVLGTVGELEKQGFEVVRLRPDSEGHLSEEQLFDAVNEKTILVSMMLVNNETGAVFPVSAAARAIRRKKAPALLHTDAVQAFGKLEFSPAKLGADLCTVSAHKVHGPKGVGALYVSKSARILPHTFGGGQEKGLRPGTESVPLICAFGEAVRLLPKASEAGPEMERLNGLLRGKLRELPEVTVNSPEDGLPYILNFSGRPGAGGNHAAFFGGTEYFCFLRFGLWESQNPAMCWEQWACRRRELVLHCGSVFPASVKRMMYWRWRKR